MKTSGSLGKRRATRGEGKVQNLYSLVPVQCVYIYALFPGSQVLVYIRVRVCMQRESKPETEARVYIYLVRAFHSKSHIYIICHYSCAEVDSTRYSVEAENIISCEHRDCK